MFTQIMKKNIAIFIFDDAEVLDFAGPFEVFSVTSELSNHELFNVFTVAKEKKPVRAVNGLSVNPDVDFASCPKVDILIIAGGSGTRALMRDAEVLSWVQTTTENAEFALSICSGARLLGALGLLDGKSYCTHHEVYPHLAEIAPLGVPQPERRFVQAGKIFTSGGISAGIDLSFYVVEMLCGEDVARGTAKYMEYRRERTNAE
jgi:transcriptional regulator GlxA family with amidase domain